MEEEVKKAIEESGMQCMAVYNAFTKDAPDEQTQRMYFVVRKEQMDYSKRMVYTAKEYRNTQKKRCIL